MILLETEPINVPLWVTVVAALLAAIGPFWGNIKDTFNLIIKGKQAIRLRKTQIDLEEFVEMKQLIYKLQQENRRLERDKNVLATAIVGMMDEYIRTNPDNKIFIETIKLTLKSIDMYGKGDTTPTP